MLIFSVSFLGRGVQPVVEMSRGDAGAFPRQVDAVDDIGSRRSDAESGAYRSLE